MLKKIGLIVDSTFGLEKNYVKEKDIKIASLKVLIEDKEYIDGVVDPEIVVQALEHKKQVKTSQPTPEQFISAIEEQLKTYEDVIIMTLSKTLSGTFNSANLAKTILENPHVYVVDTGSTINGSAYLAEKVIEYIEENHSIEETLLFLEEEKKKGSLIFTVNNLQTLVTNGRLSAVSAFIGNILKIKPILRFREGVLDVEHKVRSMGNAMLYLINETKKLLEKGKVVVRIAYVDTSLQAKELEHQIFQLGDDVSVSLTGIISPVISAHVGLGGLGVYLTTV